MPRKKKIEEGLVLTKENLLYQPLSLAISGYDASASQQNVIIGVLRKLKGALTEMKDAQFDNSPKQLTLFETEGARVYQESDVSLSFSLHMKELGVEANNYKRAFEDVCKLSDIPVWVPKVGEDGKEQFVRDHLLKIIVDKENLMFDEEGRVTGYKYESRNPVLHIGLSKAVADVVFSSQSRIYDFIDNTALMIADKFPKRIYMYLSNCKYMEDFVIGYDKFRRYMGLDNGDTKQYERFYDFKTRVIQPAEKVLKDMADKKLCDFWFEWEAIYENGRKPHPDKLKFTFHLSEVGQNIRDDKSVTPQAFKLEERLLKDFDQTTSQAHKIVLALHPSQYDGVNAKLDELKRYFESTRTNIKDRRAYTNKVITNFIAASDTPNTEEKKEESSGVSKEMADKIINELPIDWRDAFVVQDWSGDVVVVKVASRTTWEVFVGRNGDMMERVGEKLGVKINVVY